MARPKLSEKERERRERIDREPDPDLRAVMVAVEEAKSLHRLFKHVEEMLGLMRYFKENKNPGPDLLNRMREQYPHDAVVLARRFLAFDRDDRLEEGEEWKKGVPED
jgi:hypothetical protein